MAKGLLKLTIERLGADTWHAIASDVWSDGETVDTELSRVVSTVEQAFDVLLGTYPLARREHVEIVDKDNMGATSECVTHHNYRQRTARAHHARTGNPRRRGPACGGWRVTRPIVWCRELAAHVRGAAL